jgi:hypothetical protein
MTERPSANCPFECYYDAHRGTYLVLDYDQNWIELKESQVAKRLKQAKVSSLKDANGLSAIDHMLIAVQNYNSVAYTGPLAGHPRGINFMGGQKILVTSQAKRVGEHPGEWSTIKAWLSGQFVDVGTACDQLPTAYSWIQVADECFTTGIRRPGQALAIAGPRGCGKSLFQKFLTEVFGGRSGKPYGFMMGATPFNRELFGAEHLMIEDEVASQDLRVRRSFGSFIKQMVANEVIGCHGKHREGISLQPIWRLSITLNDEPENLMILPPLDESLADKIILFRAFKRPMPMPTDTLEQMSLFWIQLMKELPAFMHFIRREWKIPAELQDQRYGVRHYHHPILVQAIDILSPEFKLLNLIDTAILSPERPEWLGTSEALEKQLHEHPASSYAVKRLLNFNNACGTYLGHLAKKRANRVMMDGRRENHRLWKLVLDPRQEEADVEEGLRMTPSVEPMI